MLNQFSSDKVPCEKVMTLVICTASYSPEAHKEKHKNGH